MADVKHQFEISALLFALSKCLCHAVDITQLNFANDNHTIQVARLQRILLRETYEVAKTAQALVSILSLAIAS